MIHNPPLQTAQYRLARHYLGKLRSADEAVRRGQASVSYGRTLFAQEWEQIKLWQAWAAQRGNEDELSAQLCKDFPLAGLEVLANYTSSAEYAAWLESGMEAAQQLGDAEAERALCNELAMTSYRLGSLDTVERLAHQLLALGETAQDRLSIERAVLLLGVFADERGLYSEAERHYQHALQLATELKLDGERVRALNGLGAVAMYRGDYSKAYPYFLSQLELLEAAGKKSGICHALIALGRVLIGLKAYDEAETHLRRAVELCRALNFRRLLGVGLLNLGLSALKQNQLESACGSLHEGIEIVRGIRIPRQIMRGLALLGDTERRQGDFAGAFEHLCEGLQLARETGMPRHICDLQLHLADTYLAVDQLDAACAALSESLTLAHSMKSRSQMVSAVSSSITYALCMGWCEQAAIWAGAIMADRDTDQVLMEPVYANLEAALGSVPYQSALEQGRTLKVDEITPEIIVLLTR